MENKSELAQARVGQPLQLALLLVLLALLVVLCYDARVGLSGSFWAVLGVSALVVVLLVGQMRRYARLARLADGLQNTLSQLRGELDMLQARTEAAKERETTQEGGEAEHAIDVRGMVEALQAVPPEGLCAKYFSLIASAFEVVQGLVFQEGEDGVYHLADSYAYYSDGTPAAPFRAGETLTGQVVRNDKSLYLSDIPVEYTIIVSGLGRSAPRFLFIIPFSGSGEDGCRGVVELAFFRPLTEGERRALEELTLEFGARVAPRRALENR